MLKIASNKFDQLFTIRELFVFEQLVGHRREVIAVITEYTKGTIDIDIDIHPDGDYEFFRARAAHAGVSRSSFHKWHNQASVTLCHKTKQVKIGPIGQLIVSKRGIGLGPALMACVIYWLKGQDVDDYIISPGSLSSVDAATDSAREQRNRFYMAFGFTLLDWNGGATGLSVADGSFTALNVAALSVPDRCKDRLKPWSAFENGLKDEGEYGVHTWASLKAWTVGRRVYCGLNAGF